MEQNSLCANTGGKKLIEYWNYLQFRQEKLDYTAHLLRSVVSERSSRTLIDLQNIIRQKELNYTRRHSPREVYSRKT
jgi:hypothetical protein